MATAAQPVTHKSVATRPKTKKIPESLIYEMLDGKLIYRKGYREVLSGKKTLEEIMGASTLQSVIVWYLTTFIGRFINEDQFFVLVSEPDVHIDHHTNLANVIAIYHQSILPPSKISKKYADVPPQIVLEIDIDADLTDLTETGYIYKKTRKLLDFGVEKVFWVLTDAQAVIVATNERIETIDWMRSIELMDGQVFNVGEYLRKHGIVVE